MVGTLKVGINTYASSQFGAIRGINLEVVQLEIYYR